MPHPIRRRLVRIVLPVASAAVAVALVVVGVDFGSADPGDSGDQARSSSARLATRAEVSVAPTDSPYLVRRAKTFSRSAKRVTLKKLPAVEDREYMTSNLNLWPHPRESGKPLDVLDEGGIVALTGVTKAGFSQIVYQRQLRWVHSAHLSDKKPAPEPEEPAASAASASSSSSAASAGTSSAPCPDGSGTEAGLTSSAVQLFRAVCNAFPALSSYGGYDGHGEHSSGKAIDFMVSDSGTGQAVADWARAHAAELDLYDIIWSQHIWTDVRSSEGWRSMSDRGSATANHYDHVHIAVN